MNGDTFPPIPILCPQYITTFRCFFFIPSRRRRRHRGRKSSPIPLQDLAGSDAGGGLTSDGSIGGLSDDAPCFDLSGCDDAIDRDGADDGDDGVDGVSDHEMETSLDIELRNALLSTPLDVPTHRPSQCEGILEAATGLL